MPRPQRLLATACAVVALALSAPARAGGIDELPDQGAQALGRGATFTAKADDATALYYNVAGIARLRGTRLQISANLQFNSFYFARTGHYPDDPADPATPWGGKVFPVVQDRNTSFVLPMMVATSDLGMFDRLTFGFGVWGPAATSRTFPIGVGGKPAPSRYDYVQSKSGLFFPTLAAAYRLTPQIDLGVGVHLAVATADELTVQYADAGGGSCKNAEAFSCDATGTFKGSGMGFGGSFGILARAASWLQLGAQVKSPSSITIEGESAGKLFSGTELPPSPATAQLDLPWIVRAGIRYVGMERTFEKYDVELDGTYEAWAAAVGAGPSVSTTIAGQKATITDPHYWKDTFSVRLGGAYNIPFDDFTLTLRAGGFFDSPTTDDAYTRIATNTMAKIAGTLGAGIKRGAFTANIAYAGVDSMSRSVTDGQLRPQNGAKGGDTVDGNGKQLPVVNNGEYRSFTHVVSIGVEVEFEELFFKKRKPTFGDPEVEDLEVTSASKPENREEKRREKK